MVGLKIGIIIGQQVSSLAGFGVLHATQVGFCLDDDVVGVDDPLEFFLAMTVKDEGESRIANRNSKQER
ncbi:MAG: hypothetical protein OCC46_03575 [Pseudodesulfovibrio sp.]